MFLWYSTAEQPHSRYVLSGPVVHFLGDCISAFQFIQYLLFFSNVYKQQLKIILFLNQKNLLPQIGDLRGKKSKTKPARLIHWLN